LIPQFQTLVEQVFNKLSRFTPNSQGKTGFGSGFLIGLSIGLLWTPCVGPILASVIALALTGTVTGTAAIITFSYALGTAIPMFAILYGGRNLLLRVPWLLSNTGRIQKAFGIIMVLTAIGLFFNFDRNFQTYILNTFPEYGTGLTKIEDNAQVQEQLGQLSAPQSNSSLSSKGKAPEFIAGGQWFNWPVEEEGLLLSELKGKVVLVDFWTYTCINCIRTLPYIEKWYEKYKDKGFVVVGVHTPEFEFEKEEKNVQKAIKDFGITYPVMQDNNYSTWNAYSNRYWPAHYLIDKDGVIRYTSFGEGEYDTTEKNIQKLLEEAGNSISDSVNNPAYKIDAQTPETYIGYKRSNSFVSFADLHRDMKYRYTLPKTIPLDYFGLSGDWIIGAEQAKSFTSANLQLSFQAKDVYLVMKPQNKAAGKVKVYLDGDIISNEDAGEDVKDGVVTVYSDRLYKLVKFNSSESHQLKLEFEDNNVEVYAFTFG
jgi:thiol-disulfide isomerase/thioredoxin